jgi:hypothetical protein
MFVASILRELLVGTVRVFGFELRSLDGMCCRKANRLSEGDRSCRFGGVQSFNSRRNLVCGLVCVIPINTLG